MKNVNKKVLKVVERLMRNEATQSAGKFPPPCLGIFHQPKRPTNQKKIGGRQWKVQTHRGTRMEILLKLLKYELLKWNSKESI